MFVDEVKPGGQWLVEHRREMDRGECGWLDALGAFDADRGWAADGQMSCVDWLRWKTKMARASCYEKVHLAQQLPLRPVVAQAFRDGTISYSAARLICRMEDPDEATDEAVVRVAQRGTVRQVEQLVRHYEQLADQERPPGDPDRHRGVRVRPLEDGWVRVEATLTELEAAELVAALEAFAAVARRSAQADDGEAGDAGDDVGDDLSGPDDSGSPEEPDESARADDEAVGSDGRRSARADDDGAGAGVGSERGGSARADDEEAAGPDDGRDGDRARRWRANRAEALVDLARVALAHADGGHAAGDDRYLVHLVATDGQFTFLDGTPVDPASAATVGCDASLVSHTVDEHGEPLALGRKTRTWSTAQRRAVLVRDGGHCRFPGCERRIVDVHHRTSWEVGGLTDVENAMAVCRHHHGLLHHGFRADLDREGGLRFERPDGSYLGTTYPAQRRLALAA